MLLNPEDVVGRPVVDKDGHSVGQATAWYQYPSELDLPTGVAAVRTGRLLRSTHLVDLSDAAVDQRGLAVAYPRQLIVSAPNYPPMIGNTLSHPHAAEVLAHYRASMAAA